MYNLIYFLKDEKQKQIAERCRHINEENEEEEIDLIDHDQNGEDINANNNKRKGNSHIYRYQKDDPKGPLRTKENYLEDLKHRTNGVKGPCVLSYLKYFHPCDSTCIDYMHSVLEGVIKNFLSLWFETPISYPYSLKKYMQEIDNRLLKIRPPTFLPSTPRTIYSYNLREGLRPPRAPLPAPPALI